MRICALVIQLLVLLPAHVFAAPILVQTGEHEGFTRLVISTEVGAEWTTLRDGDYINVAIAGATDGFNLTEIFMALLFAADR